MSGLSAFHMISKQLAATCRHCNYIAKELNSFGRTVKNIIWLKSSSALAAFQVSTSAVWVLPSVSEDGRVPKAWASSKIWFVFFWGGGQSWRTPFIHFFPKTTNTWDTLFGFADPNPPQKNTIIKTISDRFRSHGGFPIGKLIWTNQLSKGRAERPFRL